LVDPTAAAAATAVDDDDEGLLREWEKEFGKTGSEEIEAERGEAAREEAR